MKKVLLIQKGSLGSVDLSISLSQKHFSIVCIDSMHQAQEALLDAKFDLVLLNAKDALEALVALSIYSKMEFGELSVLLDERRVLYKDREIELRRREFDVLVFLVKHKTKVVSREAVLDGLGFQCDVSDRAVDTHIARLRKKIFEGTRGNILVKSIYGVGYRLDCPGITEK